MEYMSFKTEPISAAAILEFPSRDLNFQGSVSHEVFKHVGVNIQISVDQVFLQLCCAIF